MFRKRSVPPNRGGQVCLQKHTCLLLVLQLLRQERGERRAPKSASNETLVKTQTCSKFVTTWGPTLRREAQPMLSEKPNQSQSHPSTYLSHPAAGPSQGTGQSAAPQGQGPRPSSLADKVEPQNVPWARGGREPLFVSTPSLRAPANWTLRKWFSQLI